MKAAMLHGGVVLALFLLQFVLPEYHHANVARIMVYALLAIGYNVLFGYTGLMSLGHAMFFAAGAYGAALVAYWLGYGPLAAFGCGVLAAVVSAMVAGGLLLRVSGVAFLIVTLMLAQAAYLTVLYFNSITLGDQGIVLSNVAAVEFFGQQFSLSDPAVKYNAALFVFAVTLAVTFKLVRSPFGRVLVAIRENEARTRMLGYNTFLYRYMAIVISGTISGISGALYALLFSYAGASFASLQYSTLPLLWTLLGGSGTLIGPIIGTGLMFYLVDIASNYTQAYMLVVGLALVVLTLWFPQGIAGMLRRSLKAWLP